MLGYLATSAGLYYHSEKLACSIEWRNHEAWSSCLRPTVSGIVVFQTFTFWKDPGSTTLNILNKLRLMHGQLMMFSSWFSYQQMYTINLFTSHRSELHKNDTDDNSFMKWSIVRSRPKWPLHFGVSHHGQPHGAVADMQHGCFSTRHLDGDLLTHCK